MTVSLVEEDDIRLSSSESSLRVGRPWPCKLVYYIAAANMRVSLLVSQLVSICFLSLTRRSFIPGPLGALCVDLLLLHWHALISALCPYVNLGYDADVS